MMGYTVFDYEGPEAFTYMNPEKKANQNKPGVYYDEQKGMYVFRRDPETGEEIPEDQHTRPLTEGKPKKRNPLVLAALALGGLYLATR